MNLLVNRLRTSWEAKRGPRHAAAGRTGWSLVLLLLLVGCGVEQKTMTVDHETMIALMVDMHLERARADVGGSTSAIHADSILALHGITEPEFRAAMTYYAQNPDVYVTLLDTVIDRMRAMRPQADAQAPESPMIRRFGSLRSDTATDAVQ